MRSDLKETYIVMNIRKGFKFTVLVEFNIQEMDLSEIKDWIQDFKER
jgi:hypothetical protein